MSERLGKLEAADFDRWLSLSEKAAIEANKTANDAFTAALNRQIKRRRETVARGTFVDFSPAIGALRTRGAVPISACGSPAAMCAESGTPGGATETLK